MAFQPEHVAVVGATGPTGYHLTRELARRGRAVRAVSRRLEALETLFTPRSERDGAIEVVAGDALEPESIRRAVEGCDLVVDCIGLPSERMADHPATARNVVRAAGDARCLLVSSYWAFFPHRGEVVSESHPREGGHPWFRMRREAEDIVLGEGGAVVHLPDFFGPHVHTGSVQNALEEALTGKPVSCIGGPDVEREAAFVPDAMRIVADLAECDEAYGTDWAVPGTGPLSPRELAAIATGHLGREVKLRSVPPWLLRLLALFMADLRPVVPLAPHYARPVRYDTSKLRDLLGEVPTTPFEEALPATLDWIAAR
jgi:nucleoside-diphosphate-sugar epimerase